LPVTLVDTAGWRDTVDPVEKAGIQRGRDRAASADLVLLLRARGGPAAAPAAGSAGLLRIMTMADLPGIDLTADRVAPEALAISAVTGLGMDALMAEIARRARDSLAVGHAIITRDRHRRALRDALASLRRLNDSAPVELVAEDLRGAALALAAITGRIGPEEILDEIFSSFCIGK